MIGVGSVLVTAFVAAYSTACMHISCGYFFEYLSIYIARPIRTIVDKFVLFIFTSAIILGIGKMMYIAYLGFCDRGEDYQVFPWMSLFDNTRMMMAKSATSLGWKGLHIALATLLLATSAITIVNNDAWWLKKRRLYSLLFFVIILWSYNKLGGMSPMAATLVNLGVSFAAILVDFVLPNKYISSVIYFILIAIPLIFEVILLFGSILVMVIDYLVV